MHMRHMIYLLLASIIFPSSAAAQNRGLVSTDPAVYEVSYIEVMPSSRATAAAALKQYREMSRKDGGYISVEVMEQIGRPAHFAVLEKWTDQKSFDTHALAAHIDQLQSKLGPIRVSSYDQRPYKTLTPGAVPAAGNDREIVVVSHVDTAGPQADGPGLLRRLAETSRKDEGNLRFDVLQGATRANHFTIVETWQSQRELDAHAAAAHTKQFRDAIQPVLGSPLDARLFKLLN